MEMINQGACTIGRQTVTAGGPTMKTYGGVIKEQVCISGEVVTGGDTVVEKRYVPPGSTCVCHDGPDVCVLETIHDHPPPSGSSTIMVGSGIGTMTVGKGARTVMRFG